MKIEDIKINQSFKSMIPSLTSDEYKQLEKNCLIEGIREKIILWNGFIVDGHNRFEIAKNHSLKFEVDEKQFDGEFEAIDWMLNNQLGRRNVTQQQKDYLIGKRYENEKQRHGGQLPKKGLDKMSNPSNSHDRIADEAGISSREVQRNEEYSKGVDKLEEEYKQKVLQGQSKVNKQDVREISKAEPDFVAKSDDEILRKAKEIRDKKNAEKIAKRIQLIEEQKEDIRSGKLPELEGKFDVVSIDPPWPYEIKEDAATSFDPNGRRVANPYPEMSIDEIKKIQLPLMNDSIVFLWTTHKFLKDGFDILEKWGLDYKATLVWNKEKIGMGAWFRMQCEFCLFAVKGKPFFQNTTFRDILNEARREHSRKPDGFFKMVEEVTAGRRLEYFSREKREGWEVFGNDVQKF
jgi:N6-adenosine-specific RNA methylase IME4